MASRVGTVYLLHFDTPFAHAKHYTGWTGNLPLRLLEHAAGRGARLTEVVADAGITWRLARAWPNATRTDERRLKNQGGAARRCPLCGITPRTPALAHAVPVWIETRVGGIVRFEADCAGCGARKGALTFDPAITDRHLCLACVDGGEW